MKYSAVALGLAALAAAKPLEKRQLLNFAAIADEQAAAIDSIPDSQLGPTEALVIATTAATATYNPTTAAAAASQSLSVLNKRSECATYTAYGPTVSPDTADAFLDSDIFSSAALSADAPSGYTQAFSNLHGSLQEIGYLTVKTLESYDPATCASYCSAEDLCIGFDIYFERDPSEDTTCAEEGNPPSITTIGCTLYGYHVAASLATNEGQYRDNFHVVIAGSNGYNLDSTKDKVTVDGFDTPVDFGNAAINAPLYNGFDTYLTYKTYTGPLDPRVCASACTAQTAYNKEYPNSDGTYKPCNFFVAYVLAKNDEPQGFFCSLYALPWDSSYATNTGYTDGSDVYTVYNSLGYTLSSFESDPDYGNNEELEGYSSYEEIIVLNK